jgi:hypothetical protein
VGRCLGPGLDFADDAAGGAFGFVELGEGGAKAEFFRVASIDAGDEGADEFVEEFGGEFAAREGGNGFVHVGGSAVTERVAEDAPFCFGAEKG